MNYQISLWDKIAVPFLIGMMFVSAYLVFKNNPEIMNTDTLYQKLSKNRQAAEILIQTNPANSKIAVSAVAAPPAAGRASHRLAQASEEDFHSAALSALSPDAADSIDTQMIVHPELGRLFVYNSAKGVALINTAGEMIWSFQLPGEQVFSSGPAAIAGTHVWLSTPSGHVYSFIAATGELAWYKVTRSRYLISPTFHNDQLLLFSEDNQYWNLEILNPASGEEIKRHEKFELPFSGRPIVADNILYFAGQTGHLTAVHLETGKEVWSSKGSSSFRSQPSFIGERIYVANEDGLLLAFDRKNGRKAAEIELGSTILAEVKPLTASGLAFTIDINHYLVGIDLRQNKRLWRYNLNQTGRKFHFDIFRLSQQSLTQLTFNSEIGGATVWTACTDQRICIFDAKSGQLLHRFDAKGKPVSEFFVFTDQQNPSRTWVVGAVEPDKATDLVTRAWASTITPPPAKTEQ